MLVKVGKGIELEVDVTRFNSEVMDHIIKIGLRNILMDAHASATEEKYGDEFESVARAMAEKKLEVMYSGVVRVIAERETDPVRSMALDIAERLARAEWRKKPDGEKFDNPRKRAAEYLDQHPDVMARAEIALGM